MASLADSVFHKFNINTEAVIFMYTLVYFPNIPFIPFLEVTYVLHIEYIGMSYIHSCIYIFIYIYVYSYMYIHLLSRSAFPTQYMNINMILSKITHALVTQIILLTYIVFEYSMHCLQFIIQAKPAMSLCLYSLSIIITCDCTNVIIQDKLWYFTMPFAINPMSFYSK